MIKFKPKSIENVAIRAKQRMLGSSSEAQRIGIVVSCDNFSGARNYGFALAKIVETEILRQGIESEILTLPSICDNYSALTSSSNFIEIYKEQLTNMTELILTARDFDGLVIMGKGASSVMGMLKAAISTNLPFMILTEGPSPNVEGSTLKTLSDMVGKIAAGKNNAYDLSNAEQFQTEFVGDGCDFNTSNFLNIAFEGMGLAVKDSAEAPAGSYHRATIARETAKAIVTLVKDRTAAKKLLNKKVITNAIILNYALGGSTQVLNYLLEITAILDIDINIDKALTLIKNVPVLVSSLATFTKNGGTYGLLKALNSLTLIDANIKLYNGQLLSDLLKQTKEVKFEKLQKESLIVMRGNLCEKYGLIKTISIPSTVTKFAGKARVFNSDNAAASALLSRNIEKKTVIVINNSGKISGQGGKIISETAIAIEAMGLTEDVIVITDGNISDVGNAMVIGNIRPEGESGNLIYIKDNDEIEIDFSKTRLQADINSKEFATRQKKYVKEHVILPGFVKTYLKK